jgi:hypothetical protein
MKNNSWRIWRAKRPIQSQGRFLLIPLSSWLCYCIKCQTIIIPSGLLLAAVNKKFKGREEKVTSTG